MNHLIASLVIALLLQIGGSGGAGGSGGVGRPPLTGPQPVQGCQNYVAASGQTSISCTMGAAVTAGDLLYVCTGNAITAPSITFSGDTGTTGADLTNLAYNGSSAFVTCFYILSATGGGTTFTATYSSSFPTINVQEFSGVHGGLDLTDSTGATGTSTSPLSPAITTTVNGDLFIGYIQANNGPTITAGSGFTLGAQSGASSAIEFKTVAIAGSTTATATLSASQAWFAHAIAFKQ